MEPAKPAASVPTPKQILQDPQKIFEEIINPPPPVFPDKVKLSGHYYLMKMHDGKVLKVPIEVKKCFTQLNDQFDTYALKHSGQEGFSTDQVLEFDNDPNKVMVDAVGVPAPVYPETKVFEEAIRMATLMVETPFPEDFVITKPPDVFKPIDITQLGPPPPIKPPPDLHKRLTAWAKDWYDNVAPKMLRNEFFALANLFDSLDNKQLLSLATLALEARLLILDKEPNCLLEFCEKELHELFTRETEKQKKELPLNPPAAIAMRIYLGQANNLTEEEQKKIIEDNKWMGARPDIPELPNEIKEEPEGEEDAEPEDD